MDHKYQDALNKDLEITESPGFKSPEEAFQLLCSKISYLSNKKDLETISNAYHFAKEKHKDQKRQSGEPYIVHPISVALILTDFKVDGPSIVSALLHDVVEDTNTDLKEITDNFGLTITELVDGLTKIGKIKFRSNQERMAENFRKMILAMAKDLRVILVKLADRLHNMRTLSILPPLKRQRISQETLEIYAPLASRLGIYGIKSELEDLCLKEMHYEIYKDIASNIVAKKKVRSLYISEVREILENELEKYNFTHFQVYGRPKHFFSIYRKMVDRNLSFKDIHDLFGFRIIVDTIRDCYEVLGIVHSMWKPMPGRFKDYIAMPKANLYQSLHTTVVRPNGMTAEIQIRTVSMHSICEYGIAAHWSYKEKNKNEIANLEKFSWLRQMLELQKEIKDPGEFLAAVKVDLFEEEIFVFTPKGDVKQLMLGATALDFAFSVHTDVGLSTIGARVNGRIRPLRWKIQSGDIVEVITSTTQKPSKDWLDFVTTTKARNKIRSFIRNEQRIKGKKIGKEILYHELKKKGFNLEGLIAKQECFLRIASVKTLEDLYVSIGYGKISAKDLVRKVLSIEKENEQNEKQKNENLEFDRSRQVAKIPSSGILVSGLDNVLLSLSKCCNPLPGEDIIGFVTRGRGVSIHKESCPIAFDLDPARKVDVMWAENEKDQGKHVVFLEVITEERQGILAEITKAISDCRVNINKAQVRLSSDLRGILDFEIVLNNFEQLNKVISAIQMVHNVLLVRRKTQRNYKK